MFLNDGNKGVMPSDCEGVRKFDCGVKEIMIGRIILIILYAFILGYSVFGLVIFRTKSLLSAYVGTLAIAACVRITLFSLPLYYTWRLTQSGKGIVLLLDILPEAVYFVAFFILLISYIFYIRAYRALYRRREMSLYSSSTLATDKETMVSNWKKYSVLTVGIILMLVALTTLVMNIIWMTDESDEVYNKNSPIADSVFIVILSIIFEAILVGVTVKYPYKIKTGILIALFPGIKAIISTYEWYIWSIDRTTWLILWICYFIATELLPYTIFTTMVVFKSYKKKRNTLMDKPLLY